MFVHLKEDLTVDPVNWIGAKPEADPDESENAFSSASASMSARAGNGRAGGGAAGREPDLTSYGVEKDMQRLLAAVRTDLDSFSDAEAYTLMASAYKMKIGRASCRERV